MVLIISSIPDDDFLSNFDIISNTSVSFVGKKTIEDSFLSTLIGSV